jgi:C6 transcription factor Pro1
MLPSRACEKRCYDINQQRSKGTLLQKARAMESITQIMVFETGMAKTTGLNLHLAAAISLFEEILESSKLGGGTDIERIMCGLEKPSWAPLFTHRPSWNTDQAALRFFLAILVWADIVSSTSLQTVPRLRKHYASLVCHEYGDATTEPLFRMEEYIGCEGWALIAIAETAALDVYKREKQANGTLTTSQPWYFRRSLHILLCASPLSLVVAIR